MKAIFFEKFKTLFAEINPTFIGELGTHNAETALQFSNLALKLSPNKQVTYYGYDVFDIAKDNIEIKTKERNAKGPGSLQLAKQKLQNLKTVNDRFKFKLFQGYTQDTLKEEISFDFVYIDAGHSYDSVVYDWNKVKTSKLIVFDDIKLKSVLKAIKDHVEPFHEVEYVQRSASNRGIAIVRNYK